jgi:hypothetical protein
VFTPSEEGAEVVKTPTALEDGVLEGSRMLTCPIPPIADGTVANVTFEWSGGDPVNLYAPSEGANTLYSASWYTGQTISAPPPRAYTHTRTQRGTRICCLRVPVYGTTKKREVRVPGGAVCH